MNTTQGLLATIANREAEFVSALSNTRAELVAKAEAAVAMYPQYAGAFDKYVLVRVRRDVRIKMGLAFTAGEFAIAAPEPRMETIRGKDKSFRTVWSVANRVDTSVDERYIQVVM